jgi:hypothetical protein
VEPGAGRLSGNSRGRLVQPRPGLEVKGGRPMVTWRALEAALDWVGTLMFAGFWLAVVGLALVLYFTG